MTWPTYHFCFGKGHRVNESNQQFHRGNIVLLKRTLADFIGTIQSVDEVNGKLTLRFIDSPPDTPPEVVSIKDVIKLAEQQEKELPETFLSSIDKQRQIIFAPKKEPKKNSISSAVSLKDVDDATYQQILDILAEDDKGNGEEINE
jgi:hypothetical protein